METYKFLLDLCLILLSTKVLGLLTRKFSMPQVVGALLAGVILGPGILGIITPTDFISDTAEVGVIVLTFLISCTAAPVGAVTTPIRPAYCGMGCLYSAANMPISS